ncbi:chemotaxis response regulator protein-glutamate methylesterase [bacterium DOLZORAL124_64_63]|nr:MAG: chemotaxis response regulator protein-glutamate methylesterase [bacterium DOLZORAL124_64_63]
MNKAIRVLIIDDSALVREILAAGLAMDPQIEVVGTATDPFDAKDKIVKLRPDVMTLDVEMPRMDGVEFLRQLMPQFPVPVVMVSALTERGKKITLAALEAGAVDFVTKPKGSLAAGLQGMMRQLIAKVKVASTANVSGWKGRKPVRRVGASSSRPEAAGNQVIVIGASTGGTEAIREVLQKFPETMPGVIITQHMPAGFTKLFAERLDSLVPMEVKEATEGDWIIPGRVLIAPGNHHMSVVCSGGSYKVSCRRGEKVNGHCPSVELMMQSAAKALGKNAVGIMLTGMGGDGARGLLAMRQAGARTLAQDEASSVVFGMPKVAFEMGGAEKLVPLGRIADTVIHWLNKNEARI